MRKTCKCLATIVSTAHLLATPTGQTTCVDGVKVASKLEHGAMVYCSTGFEEWMPAGESKCPLCGKNIMNPRFEAFFEHIVNTKY